MQSLLGELVMGGLALETSMAEIIMRFEEQEKLEKQEVILYRRMTSSVVCDVVVTSFVGCDVIRRCDVILANVTLKSRS